MTRRLYVKLNATNDVNGNPRRLFQVFSMAGNLLNTIDEGYSGDTALRTLYPEVKMVHLGTYEITPTQYNRLKPH